MPIELGSNKVFNVKFRKPGSFQIETEQVEAAGRTGARDEITTLYPGCEIFDTWESPRHLAVKPR